MSEPAAVLMPDCPWQPRDSLPGDRGAAYKYDTIATPDLCKLVLPPRAERCVLVLWRLASMQRDALDVCDAWGFEPVAELVWRKLRPCRVCCATGRVDAWSFGGEVVLVPGRDRACPRCHEAKGRPFLGLGRTVRNRVEIAIIARPKFRAKSRKQGQAPLRLSKKIPGDFAAVMPLDVDGVLPESHGRKGSLIHSAKPDEAFAVIEALYPGPRVEMFSRRTRPGWTSAHSDQAGALDDVARTMREVWPLREREERLAKARRAAR